MKPQDAGDRAAFENALVERLAALLVSEWRRRRDGENPAAVAGDTGSNVAMGRDTNEFTKRT